MKTSVFLILALFVLTLLVYLGNSKPPENLKIICTTTVTDIKTKEIPTYTATCSFFHAIPKECGKNYKKTSRGTTIIPSKISLSRIISISKDIEKKLNLRIGDTIEILEPLQVSGKYIFESRTATWVKNRLDILLPENQIGDLYPKTIYRKYGR